MVSYGFPPYFDTVTGVATIDIAAHAHSPEALANANKELRSCTESFHPTLSSAADRFSRPSSGATE